MLWCLTDKIVPQKCLKAVVILFLYETHGYVNTLKKTNESIKILAPILINQGWIFVSAFIKMVVKGICI